MTPQTLNKITFRARADAAMNAAKAYARRCSWVELNDLEADAWEGMLRAPPFDLARAPALRSKGAGDERLYKQMYWFYWRVAVRWLSSKVPAYRAPVSCKDTHNRQALHGIAATPIESVTIPVAATAASDLESENLRRRIADRLAELMGADREGEIAAAFLLRDPETIDAATIATLFDTTPKKVYGIAERAKVRLGNDRQLVQLFGQLTE